MFYIRRLWLGPALVLTCLIYYFFWRSWRGEQYHYGQHLSKLHLDTGRYQQQHPVDAYTSLPSERAKSIPRIQYDFSTKKETSEAKKIRLERLDAVKESFMHSWTGYRNNAWAKDEVAPLSGNWRNSFGGWGATMVDTMDTLWMMGLKQDFERCVQAVEEIDFTTNTEETLNVFETTIRYLGGLLSAYDLSEGKYPVLLTKAKELGDILYLSFDTVNHMPLTRWQWAHTAMGQHLSTASDYTLVAELGSLTLEFTRLSQLTKDPKYFDAVQRIAQIMAKEQDKTKVPGLWPTVINAKDLTFQFNHFTWGGMVDSAYEYLPKQYMLLGGTDATYRDMYTKGLTTARKHLFYRPLTPQNSDILFSGNARLNDSTSQTTTETQGQHLTCFAGGMLAIASRIFSRQDDLPVARRLVNGCIWAYKSTPSGLMPELFHLAPCHIGSDPPSSTSTNPCPWSDDAYFTAVARQNTPSKDENNPVAKLSPIEAGKYWVKHLSLIPPYTSIPDPRYILRPEAIESIWILYRVTGDPSLLDEAWTIFQAIERATRTRIAHAGISDVRASSSPHKIDRCESFWLAETLKYFFLMFSDPNVLSLDEWVLNTEAHPFRRPREGEAL